MTETYMFMSQSKLANWERTSCTSIFPPDRMSVIRAKTNVFLNFFPGIITEYSNRKVPFQTKFVLLLFLFNLSFKHCSSYTFFFLITLSFTYQT